MAKYIYVDNSNVFIEGQRVAAVENDSAIDIGDAINRRVFDHSYRIDFGKLYKFVAANGDSSVAQAMLFGSRPPQNDSLWAVAKSVGFEPVIVNRNISNKEKKVDTGIVFAMTKHALAQADKANDIFILVAGDGDYVPAVVGLIEEGFRVNVVFWDHASNELKNACSEFISMNSAFGMLSR